MDVKSDSVGNINFRVKTFYYIQGGRRIKKFKKTSIMPVTNPEEELNVWLKAKGLKVPSGTGAEWTHSSLTGGVYNIRDLTRFLKSNSAKGRQQRDLSELTPAEKDARFRQQELQFLKQYGRTTANVIFRKAKLTGSTSTIHRSLTKKQMNFISEKITPIFKFFIDLDFACDSLENAYGYSSESVVKVKVDKLTKRLSALRAAGSKASAKMLETTQDKFEHYNSIYTGLKHARLLSKVRLMQNTLREFYPGLETRIPNAFAAMVCLTKPKQLKNGAGYGEGVHIIFPYILVNKDQALDLRETLLDKLETEFPLLNTEISNWRKVFDGDVYGENKGALRMLGSRKAEPCQCSKRKNRQNKNGTLAAKTPNCKTCNNDHYIWTSRIYWPEYLLSGKGELMIDELISLLNPDTMIPNPDLGKPRRKDNLFRLMQLSSLRTFATQPLPEFRMPQGAQRHIPERAGNRRNPRRKKAGTAAASGGDQLAEEGRMHDEDAKTLSSLRNKRPFVNDHPWIPLFEKLIARKFGQVYKNIKVSQVFAINDKKKVQPWFLICVSGQGSNYCLNLGGDHQSNTVYFIVNEVGIYQKCHCKCDVKRPTGKLCKDYISEGKSLKDVPIFLGILFPPLYHGTVWTMPSNIKYGKMPMGFTDVLYNRMTRMKPVSLTQLSPDIVESAPPELDITQGDTNLNEELIQKIMTEIIGSDPSAKAVSENLLLESQLHADAAINPQPFNFMLNAQTEI